jgi:D-glycero-alpha-D-manno-heptose-7-phosphate kinase
MIIAKTPLKIPFAGGLTDLKAFAQRYGGATVSSSIDKYVYVALKDNLGGYFRLKYQDVQEKVAKVAHIKHDLIRESIRLAGLERTPLDIVVMADLAGESGLGSSGAVTVTLLNALYAYQGVHLSQRQLYEKASHIEVDILEGASGYHDPAICALGGLKLIEYRGADITARDIQMTPATRRTFEASLLFFYGGRHHKSKPSLALLSSRIEEATETLEAIKSLAYALERAFRAGDLQRIAEIIGEQQRLKQQLPGHFVDDYVQEVTGRVRKLGAYAQLPGGKIGSFVYVCCPDGQQTAVREALLTDHTEIALKLETGGTQVMVF